MPEEGITKGIENLLMIEGELNLPRHLPWLIFGGLSLFVGIFVTVLGLIWVYQSAPWVIISAIVGIIANLLLIGAQDTKAFYKEERASVRPFEAPVYRSLVTHINKKIGRYTNVKLLPKETLEIALHARAREAFISEVLTFGDSLLYESKSIAADEHANEVQTGHIERAQRILQTRKRTWDKFLEFLIFLGTLFLGAAIAGGSTELFNGNYWRVAAYCGLGIAGGTVFAYGFIKK